MRTKQDFDEWFAKNNGDPWGYDSPFVIDRLNKSIEFIEKYICDSDKLEFYEIGAFNGDFTSILASKYPKSRIICNDISEVALCIAREKLKNYENITYNNSDMLSFTYQSKADTKVILLLECLYYLRCEERYLALKNLFLTITDPLVFISAPIIGGTYFTEKELVKLFNFFDYKMIKAHCLNFTKLLADDLNQEIVDGDEELRVEYGRQVLYLFAKTPVAR